MASLTSRSTHDKARSLRQEREMCGKTSNSCEAWHVSDVKEIVSTASEIRRRVDTSSLLIVLVCWLRRIELTATNAALHEQGESSGQQAILRGQVKARFEAGRPVRAYLLLRVTRVDIPTDQLAAAKAATHSSLGPCIARQGDHHHTAAINWSARPQRLGTMRSLAALT